MTETAAVVKKFPTLCFLGHSRCGKDTAGLFLTSLFDVRFVGSSSYAMRHYVAEKLGVDVEIAWNDRHKNREQWKQILDDAREVHGYDFCIKEVLKENDIVAGLRDLRELHEGRKSGLLDLIIWVDNPRQPPDPTVCFGTNNCDIIIENNGCIRSYYDKLFCLGKAVGLPLRK